MGVSLGAATDLMTDEIKNPVPIYALVLGSIFSDIIVLLIEIAGGMGKKGISHELVQMLVRSWSVCRRLML